MPLTKDEVTRLKVHADGNKRPVISYMSIGEAETYRFYWRKDWADDDMPGWHVRRTAPGRAPHGAFLARRLEGHHLPRPEILSEAHHRCRLRRRLSRPRRRLRTSGEERPTARDDMIDFVTKWRRRRASIKTGFSSSPRTPRICSTKSAIANHRRPRQGRPALRSRRPGFATSHQDIAWSHERLKLCWAIGSPCSPSNISKEGADRGPQGISAPRHGADVRTSLARRRRSAIAARRQREASRHPRMDRHPMQGQTALVESEPMPRQTLILPDGRNLAYRIYGAPDGEPVLRLPWRTRHEHDVRARRQNRAILNLKLICPDRPGYGGSSAAPDRGLHGWSKDVAALLSRLGIARFGIIGISGGGPYATTCAATFQ